MILVEVILVELLSERVDSKAGDVKDLEVIEIVKVVGNNVDRDWMEEVGVEVFVLVCRGKNGEV